MLEHNLYKHLGKDTHQEYLVRIVPKREERLWYISIEK